MTKKMQILIGYDGSDCAEAALDDLKRAGLPPVAEASVGHGNPFERFVLGSVSSSVAARAHCSVEVVRPPESDGGNNHERQSAFSRN